MFAMELWATKRAIEGFEETLSRSRARLAWFKANVELYKTIPFSGLIEILRDHRNILESSKERIEAHIRKFQVSSLRAMHHSDALRTDFHTEVKTLLVRLRESRAGMQAVVETNEQLIQGCLFNLQLELTNTQLVESWRSIEQNATVKRLTALAFVFIPISTVAGTFGMNVHGLADVKLWIFLVGQLWCFWCPSSWLVTGMSRPC
jgi:Mg2+ and Co2+ transporter CorA